MTSTKRWRRPRSALHICSRTTTENVPERKRVRPSSALHRAAGLIAESDPGFRIEGGRRSSVGRGPFVTHSALCILLWSMGGSGWFSGVLDAPVLFSSLIDAFGCFTLMVSFFVFHRAQRQS